MKELLDPIAMIPGVRCAALISPDGVPILALEGATARSDDQRECQNPMADIQAFSALAAGWLGDATRTVDPLAWNPPQRVVLAGTRGSLVLCQGPSAVLVVMLEHGVRAEDLRIPMDSALARMQRVLRGMGSSINHTTPVASDPRPEGIFPSTGGVPSGQYSPESAPASSTTDNNG